MLNLNNVSGDLKNANETAVQLFNKRAVPGKRSTYCLTLAVFLVSQVKSQQAEVIRILESKSIKYELIDISVGGDVRDEMRSKSGNPTAIPPQIFNEDQYCGVRRISFKF